MHSITDWIYLLSTILLGVLSMTILVTCGFWRGHFCYSCVPALHIKVELQLQLPFQHKNIPPWREAGNGNERSALEYHIPNSTAIAKYPCFPVSKSTWHSSSEWFQAVTSNQTPMGWRAFLCGKSSLCVAAKRGNVGRQQALAAAQQVFPTKNLPSKSKQVPGL